jgi:glycosyltransferase involved in cell wall biosynthesis
MAAKVPVVATSVAMAGIEATPNRDFLLADESKQFAEHVISLLLDRKKAKQLAENAFKFIQQKHDWERNLEKMEEVLMSLAC